MSVSFQWKVFANQTASAAITLWKKVLHPPTNKVRHFVRFGIVDIVTMARVVLKLYFAICLTAYICKTLCAIVNRKDNLL